VDDVMADGGLRQLPSAVLRRRQQATDKVHPDRHLALLWDDFFSRPDSYAALRVPPSQGGRS
jgi:hypothetical protein